MKTSYGTWALVTGGTSGIGAALHGAPRGLVGWMFKKMMGRALELGAPAAAHT